MMRVMTERREIKQRSQAVWDRVKAAYLAGEPAASVARRYDVGYGNLRYRAHAEGWTRKADILRAEKAADAEAERLAGACDGGDDDAQILDPTLALPAPAAPESAVAPAVAVARGLARASAALARGDAAGAAALTRAAEGLARATGQDPSAPPPPEVLDDDEDAAREAEHRQAWLALHESIEERAGVLALQLLADRRGGPAIHGGFSLHWRAANLGPEAATADRDAARDSGSFDIYWRPDGTLRPLDQIRANSLGPFRQIIRQKAGLPPKGSPWGEAPAWED